MKEAMYYEQIEDTKVICKLCPHNCKLSEKQIGICGVRENIDGKLYSLVYGKAAGGLSIDPIEKKPLFHFLPGSLALSFGTVGCNMKCKHCQNYFTSQAKPFGEVISREKNPQEIVNIAKEQACQEIAYTYNEPVIFYEYMIETAKLAKKAGIKNIMVSNGYINEEPLIELCKYLDGINIDLKSMSDLFYKRITGSKLDPVLKSLKTIKKEGVWLEITFLIIPGENDEPEEIKKATNWIKENLGENTPLHFSAFHPDYEMQTVPVTPITSLMNAYDIAKTAGLKHVYLGNVMTQKYENTYCPKCDCMLIKRMGFNIKTEGIEKNKCKNCNEEIKGLF